MSLTNAGRRPGASSATQGAQPTIKDRGGGTKSPLVLHGLPISPLRLRVRLPVTSLADLFEHFNVPSLIDQ